MTSLEKSSQGIFRISAGEKIVALTRSERLRFARKVKELDRAGRHQEAVELYRQLVELTSQADEAAAA